MAIILIQMMRCAPSPTEPAAEDLPNGTDSILTSQKKESGKPKPVFTLVKNDIRMKNYFFFIDSLADTSFHSRSILNEYLLVNANPWLIDSLRTLDYYTQKKKGVFIYDQAQQIILHAGDRLIIPDTAMRAAITQKLESSYLDVNIPEYTLRMIQGHDTLLTCPIRIGRDAEGYLDYYQRQVDFRTPVGEGEIKRVRRNPKYIDLQSGEEYKETNRDDGRRTKMPIIPSLEPSINGKLIGTLIHATTNPKSLGKAYSHGCVGTSEADIWFIYYCSPPGTKVRFRYDLEIKDANGKSAQLKDIYHLKTK